MQTEQKLRSVTSVAQQELGLVIFLLAGTLLEKTALQRRLKKQKMEVGQLLESPSRNVVTK